MYCRKCGKSIGDSEKTCLNCGAEAARKYLPKYSLELYYCKSCGKEADKNDAFCRKCGAALNFSDVITGDATRRKEMKPIKGSKWMYIPIFPQPEKDEADESALGDKTNVDEPVPEKNEADKPLDGEPKEKTPLSFAGEISIELTDEEAPAPEKAEEPEFTPVHNEESADGYDFAKQQPKDEPIASEETAAEPESTANAQAEYEPVEEAPAKPEPVPDEESANPDLLLSHPTVNGDYVPPAESAAKAEPAKEELSAQSGEPTNYSTDDGEKDEKIDDNSATVTITKPKSVPEKIAFGVIAIAIAVLCPPLGIILGIMTASRGWSVANKSYVRLGIAAIVVGVLMTIAVSILMWKIFIPAIETYFKEIE